MARVVVTSEDIVSKIVDGEAILINLSTGTYYSLDGTGAVVWAMLQGGTSADEIATELAERYSVAREKTAEDVARLVDELTEEGLLLPADDDAAPARPEVDLPPPGEYAPPALDKYTDMQEMLSLDPPLPGIEDIPWEPPAA
jgi:hypothetical protein